MRRHIFTMFYIIAFLALAGISFWDAYLITYSYLKENKMTSVHRENISERFPFIGEAEVCLANKYQNPFSVGISNQSQYFSMLRQAWRGQEIDFPPGMTEFERTVGHHLLKLALPMVVTRVMDSPDYETIDRITEKVGLDPSELGLIVDRFLRDPQSLERIEKYWNEIRTVFIRTDDSDSPSDMRIRPSQMLDRLCFSIPLDHDLSTLTRDKIYYMDFIELPRHSRIKYGNDSDHPVHRLPAMVYVHFHTGEYAGFLPQADEQRTHVIIGIASQGAYDGRRFPPCTPDHKTLNDCLTEMETRTILEICNCTQFSHAIPKIFARNTTVADFVRSSPTMNFCTKEIYDQCSTEARREVADRQAEAKASGECVPCLEYKNSHALFSWVNPIQKAWDRNMKYNGTWFPRSVVSFVCLDNNYVIFEERPQFTLAQFVSQIGGELGLYIGFSMISVVHLLASLYRKGWKGVSVRRVLEKMINNKEDSESERDQLVMKRLDNMEAMVIELRDYVKAKVK